MYQKMKNMSAVNPKSFNTDYGNPQYWDARFNLYEGEMEEWLESYKSLKPTLDQYLKPEHKILVLGCGNANFSEDLYDAGYENVWNIDISPACIQ